MWECWWECSHCWVYIFVEVNDVWWLVTAGRKSVPTVVNTCVLAHLFPCSSMQCPGAATGRPARCWQLEEKNKASAILFFPPFLEDIISRWAAEAVNFSQTPTPPPLCLEANPLISCVSMVLQRTILYVYEKERKREEKKSNSFFVPHLYNHFEMAAVLLCFVSWEAIWSLCKPEWEKMFFFFFGSVALCLVRN